MKINLLSNRVAIEPDPADKQSPGGIYIPATAGEESQTGTVFAIGPGIKQDDGSHTPMTVSPGLRVLFRKHAGTPIEFGGNKYTIMPEHDIIAVIE